MNSKLFIAWVLVLLMNMPAYALGDLFFTVEERLAIDFKRNNTAVSMGKEKTDEVLLNGFFFKGHDLRHKATYWVNYQLVNGSSSQLGVALKGINEQTKAVSFDYNDKVNQATLKPGQKLMLNQGKIKDAFE